MNKVTRPLLLAACTLLAVCSASAQAIIGAWTYGNTASPTSAGTGAFVFLPNGVYFHMESENTADAANGQNGMERGTYTWNSGTGAFSASTLVNTNGQWGLSNGSPGTVTISGDTLSVDGEASLTRVTGGSAIVGGWTYGNTASPTSSGTGAFVFLANGVYFHAESDNTADAANGQNGMERGTYSWNSGTNTFTKNSTAINTNGGWGLSEVTNGTSFTLTVSGNTLTTDDSTLSRVTAIPEPSTYAAFAGLGALGLAVWRRRRQAA
jgi:Flp pilus assembly protein TadG